MMAGRPIAAGEKTATPTASQCPDVIHKPNLFVVKRFGCVGDALTWEILPRGADVPNSDGRFYPRPARGSVRMSFIDRRETDCAAPVPVRPALDITSAGTSSNGRRQY